MTPRDVPGAAMAPAIEAAAATTTQTITILLSTYNGEAYLAEQLASFEAQTHRRWRLLWRDDGSTDGSVALMRDFAARVGPARCRESASSGPHFGAAESFLSLLRDAADAEAVAFADQDDVWLPEKLARAAAALAGGGDAPLLYCARYFLVDQALQGRRLSPLPRVRPGFPASLTQNIAPGNTMVMNRAAADLIAALPAPAGTIHDWWSYIVVTACGGAVVMDPEPVVLYRQHDHNLIGTPPSAFARARSAIRRGPEPYMGLMRRHVGQLTAHCDRLSAAARRDVAQIERGLAGGVTGRVATMRCPGFARQSSLENALFRLWLLLG